MIDASAFSRATGGVGPLLFILSKDHRLRVLHRVYLLYKFYQSRT